MDPIETRPNRRNKWVRVLAIVIAVVAAIFLALNFLPLLISPDHLDAVIKISL